MKNPNGILAFGIHLRRLREERNLSQQDLANEADISKMTIQRIENAKFSVTLDVIISIARGLKITVSELTDFKLPQED